MIECLLKASNSFRSISMASKSLQSSCSDGRRARRMLFITGMTTDEIWTVKKAKKIQLKYNERMLKRSGRKTKRERVKWDAYVKLSKQKRQ